MKSIFDKFLTREVRSEELFIGRRRVSSLRRLLVRLIRNQKGIALLMVLSTIAVLTVAMVELGTNSRINYRMAVHNKERVQAYYLAKSGLNFSKLILKYNKQAEKMLSQAGEQGVDLKVEPDRKST